MSGAAEAQVGRKLVWLMTLRVVIVTTLLLIAILVQTLTGTSAELNPIYSLVGATYLLTILFGTAHALGLWRRSFLHLQLLADLLLITALIYYSGGIDSPFPFFYILTILTASLLLMRRGAVLVALLACILYGTLVAFIYHGLLPQPTGFLASPQLPAPNRVYYSLLVCWMGCVAAALLSSYLAEKLRETGDTLAERSADLAELQIFYEDVINSVNSGLMSTDLEGRVISLNHAGERLLGRSFAAVRGQPLAAVLGLDPGLGARVLAATRDGLRFEHSYGPHPPRHLGLSVAPLHDRDDLHRGFTLVFQDLTPLRQLEREVRLKERMAAIGRMAAGIAHEIRNPLASISGSVQVLRADLELDGEQKALMDIVLAESERLNRIIEEFLIYAKPAPPLPQPVALATLVSETCTLFRNSPELKPEHVLQWIPGWPAAEVMADPDQIRQVLWNLLRNAAQSMPGGGRIEVRVEAGEGGGMVIAVEDEGPGFREDPELLWQPFHASGTRGAGLGLAIVYRILRDHGGRVSIANRETGGARVVLWLPRHGPGVAAEALAEAGRGEP